VVAAAIEGVPVADGHLGAAVDGLMADGEALTRSLLGSGPGGDADGFGAPGFPRPGFSGPGFRGPGVSGFSGPGPMPFPPGPQ
jgi:hypothetical protein